MGELLLSTQMCQIKYISTSFFPNVEKRTFCDGSQSCFDKVSDDGIISVPRYNKKYDGS